MQYEFRLLVEVEKTAGKFASREDVEAELIDAIDSANPNNISLDEAEYEVSVWDIQPAVTAKK